MPHLDISELIKFHFVFDELEILGDYDDVFKAIEREILLNFKALMPKFYFSSPDESAIKTALIKLARSDRKRFNICKILPRTLANRVYRELFSKDFLIIEKSREQAKKRNKHEKIKKNQKYQIEDKIHFNSHFSRFWFRFIEPNLALLKEDKFNEVLSQIRAEFDEYASVAFEILCAELMAKFWGISRNLISSFWQKNIEIDMLFYVDDKLIVSEAKFKEHKMCKNVLNLLKHKCEKLGLKPDIIVLFSKSGFSGELLSLKSENLMLFELDDFKRLIE